MMTMLSCDHHMTNRQAPNIPPARRSSRPNCRNGLHNGT